MEQTRTRVKNLNDLSSYKYAGRQYKDYAIAKEIESDLKVMVYAVLGENKTLEIQSSKTPTDFKVCGLHEKYKWFGYIKPNGYMVFANSEIGLYCEIIKKIVGDRLYIPFSY